MGNVIRIEDWFQSRDEKPVEQPKQQGVKKVSVDDGFTAIPNELLFAIGQFGFTQRQFNVLIVVIQKTLSWRKEMDWISNAQLCELVDLPDEQKASKTKQELVKMRVLRQEGKKIGLNLTISEWKKDDCTKHANLAQNVQKNLHKSCNSDCTKHANTKETITKEKINTPLPPNGENLPDGKFKTRKTRSVGEKIDFDKIAELWNLENEENGGKLPFVEKINDERKRAIKKFLGELKAPTVECAERYFQAFFESAKPHHFGENDRGWRANFDFAIKPKQVLRVREGAL
ncbi:replication protein [Rodentibacter haemolyticus]|uniref:replication protein n=1 Tax=Rodentibacter haemolyticus TaxID=2778911 RepID=UPI001E602BBD|nr:replication protein [Rodentibacter haemolyticus]